MSQEAVSILISPTDLLDDPKKLSSPLHASIYPSLKGLNIVSSLALLLSPLSSMDLNSTYKLARTHTYYRQISIITIHESTHFSN